MGEDLVSFGQNFHPTLANFLNFWANFYCSKWPNIKQITSGHTACDRKIKMSDKSYKHILGQLFCACLNCRSFQIFHTEQKL